MPPLNALRAFEAAARHLSFTRAAEELFVTQAAVSHQIKALEDWLGFKLFHRMGRGLRLSEEGQDYLPVLRDAFDTIAAATERLMRAESEQRLTMSTTDSFAAGWLVQRLKRFRTRHPEIDVRVTTTDTPVDFARSDVEFSIRDSGTGIPSDELTKIFEPYYSTKERGQGTGLGLFVTKSIVLEHGGSIEVESALGEGTEFRVVLPLAP